MKRNSGFFFLLVVILFSKGFAAVPVGFGDFFPSDEDRFRLAIQDAKRAQTSEVNRNLIDITPWNNKIIWNDAKTHILVVSLVPRWVLQFYLSPAAMAGIKRNELNVGGVRIGLNQGDIDFFRADGALNCSNHVFPNYKHGLRGYNVSWVTIVPEIQGFINDYRNSKLAEAGEDGAMVEQLRLRLNQRLGLPPDSFIPEGRDRGKLVVEQWINIKDLFRPSVDAEIFDSDALPDSIYPRSDFYAGIVHNLALDLFNAPFLSDIQRRVFLTVDWIAEADRTHKNRFLAWYTNQKRSLQEEDEYLGRNNYPWTRLGYTYDYSIEAFNRGIFFGCSEFCVKPESVASMNAIYSLDRYSRNDVTNYYKDKIREQFKSEINWAIDNMILGRELLEKVKVHLSFKNSLFKDDDRVRQMELIIVMFGHYGRDGSLIKNYAEQVNSMMTTKMNAYNNVRTLIKEYISFGVDGSLERIFDDARGEMFMHLRLLLQSVKFYEETSKIATEIAQQVHSEAA
jgi:hypothetical protein